MSAPMDCPCGHGMVWHQDRLKRTGALLGAAARADERERALTEAADDQHCATCQCAGTECQKNSWCKRVWGHGGNCNVIRDEDFRTT